MMRLNSEKHFVNHETNVRAVVLCTVKSVAGYHVLIDETHANSRAPDKIVYMVHLVDLDSGERLPTTRVFEAEADAVDYARKISETE